MKKIGRNDPCPCGSGKKYKKCCLLKENMEKTLPGFLMGDAASLRMSYLLLMTNGRDKFRQAYKGPANIIERSVLRNLPPNHLLSKSESEKILLLWREKLEEEIKKLCVNHSKYYWLHLSRRIFPECPEKPDRFSTPYLHRTTFNLAVLKYGKLHQDEEFVTVPDSFDIQHYITTEEPYNGETVNEDTLAGIEIESPGDMKKMRRHVVIPRQITRVDAIQIYQIEYLSFDYYMITAQLRRLWKGGKVRIRGGKLDNVVLPRRIETLVDLYDIRQGKYAKLLSKFGSIASLEAVKEKKHIDEFQIFVPIPNIEKIDVPLVFSGEEFFGGEVKGPKYFRHNPSNFVPVPVSIRTFYEKMCIFRQKIKEIFKFKPEEIVAFIISLEHHNKTFWLNNLQSRYSFFQRGYQLIPSTEDFQNYLTELYFRIYGEVFGDISHEDASSSCRKLINWMTYKKNDFSTISLWDRTGIKLFLPLKKKFLVDYSAIPSLLESIFTELSELSRTNGQIGQVRGDDFEHETEKYLRLNVSQLHLWVCHRKLKFQSGEERDIDVSFWLGNVLFVIECKSFSVSTFLGRGKPSSLQIRKQKIDDALNQADTLCELLCRERKGKNFKIPDAITHIISMAASPFPEYIDRKSDNYFLTPSIPRVCTPKEIVEFTNDFKLSSYISKPFVWEVKRLEA